MNCLWWLQDVKSSKTAFINKTQQCFTVKSGVDGILDLARSTFCRVTEQVHELVDKYKSDHGLDALKVSRYSLSDTSKYVVERTYFDASAQV